MDKIYRVFLSSTARDLDPWRTAVYEKLNRMLLVHPTWMKDWPAHDDKAQDVCEGYVRHCDIFVCLIGHCFGSAPDSQPNRSYTMLEYDWAEKYKKPKLIHRAPSSFRVPYDLVMAQSTEHHSLQESSRNEITVHTGQSEAWETPAKLAAAVKDAVQNQLYNMLSEERSGLLMEEFKSLLNQKREITDHLPNLTGAERAAKLMELSELERHLSEFQRIFGYTVKRSEEPESVLQEYPSILQDGKINAALESMNEEHLDEANELFTELIDSAGDIVERVAQAEYARGQIADRELRWGDAKWHYQRSTQLAPSFLRGLRWRFISARRRKRF